MSGMLLAKSEGSLPGRWGAGEEPGMAAAEPVVTGAAEPLVAGGVAARAGRDDAARAISSGSTLHLAKWVLGIRKGFRVGEACRFKK